MALLASTGCLGFNQEPFCPHQQLCQATQHHPGLSPPAQAPSLRQVTGFNGAACPSGKQQPALLRKGYNITGLCVSDVWDTWITAST